MSAYALKADISWSSNGIFIILYYTYRMDILRSLSYVFFETRNTSFREKVFIVLFLVLGLPALVILAEILIP